MMYFVNFRKKIRFIEKRVYSRAMGVNQRELAAQLNLSVATISKSLRNSSEIHPATRAEVIGLASKLGYRAARVTDG